MLRALQSEGVKEFVGLEIADAMIAYVEDRYGIQVLRDTVADLAVAEPRSFDIVVLNAVLEHVLDPDAVVAGCRGLLRRGGVLYIDVPNEPHLMARFAGLVERVLRRRRVVFHLAPSWSPYHVFGFNRSSLRALLAKHGFRLGDVHVWAAVGVPHDGSRRDRLHAQLGMAVQRMANVTGTANNMTAWAALEP